MVVSGSFQYMGGACLNTFLSDDNLDYCDSLV